eukprot:4909572-Pyramimonas_sp.AAC.1
MARGPVGKRTCPKDLRFCERPRIHTHERSGVRENFIGRRCAPPRTKKSQRRETGGTPGRTSVAMGN